MIPLIWLGMLAACQTVPEDLGRERVDAAARIGPGSPIAASDVFASEPVRKIYAVTDAATGELLGQEHRVVTAPDADGSWTVETRLIDSDGTASEPRRSTLSRRDDGAVVLLRVRTPRGDEPGDPILHFRYTPPLVMAPAVLEPGQRFVHSAEMIQIDPDDPDRELGRGTVSRTVSIGPSELCPASPRELVTEMETRFRGAVDTRLQSACLEPGPGITLEQVDRTLTVLGVPLRRSSRAFELVEAVPGGS